MKTSMLSNYKLYFEESGNKNIFRKEMKVANKKVTLEPKPVTVVEITTKLNLRKLGVCLDFTDGFKLQLLVFETAIKIIKE